MEKLCVPFDTLERAEFQVFMPDDATEGIEFDTKSIAAKGYRGKACENTDDLDDLVAQPTDTSLPECYSRASVYWEKGEYDNAIAEYTKPSVSIQPQLRLSDSGWSLRTEGEFEKAITDYTEAIRLASDDGELYASRGLAYEQNGDKAKADADFAQAKKLGYKAP